jgi:hypothetical protein
MKLLTDGQRDWLISAWKTRFARLKEADHEEVKRTLDVLFMPHIKPYLEIYNAGGGFSSLPSFGEGGLSASVPGTPHTVVGAVNYAKESNLRINNDNLAKERLYYYNLYAKNYYFRNALSLF